MTDATLPTIEVGPEDDAGAAVIWLHGLGADGHDFVPIVPHLGIPEDARVRFVFPTAPAIPVTINGGFVMPAWYDITHMELGRRHDVEGIRRSVGHLTALIERENARGVPGDRIVVAGFSQGGAIAAFGACRHRERLAGCIALSTYPVLEETWGDEQSAANADLPYFVGHGTHDPMVPLAGGERLRERLAELGHAVEWHSYPMQHEVCLEEIGHVGTWLAGRLAPGA